MTVYEETERVELQNQFCSVLPCRYDAELKPFTKYQVKVTFGYDPVMFKKAVKTLKAGEKVSVNRVF